ncbi:WYL domain-containing protein [Arthrobacter sp. zg-Y820]|uniref:helix-turn-helix transcriptional regulator n=1 Tax=unclassified Arthrobacter TaxID=235627 RepID=UPI0025414DAC|nr:MULTISPECIES: WYL domain-containing protein [unclassified Arthrobacter]MCC9196692.1 WYL domain-containing protein [Arthrobacter sp. zg-Y820]MDK1279554.1 WYL domain-containing protein [Arthrobacter sp. zg.Y820]WIB08072.1 WYL domain-containing protein [Arthrobacter sp. zg-Y820]
MPANRTERLLTLVIVLLSTRRGFTKHELFDEIELYGEAPSTAAREKLFDRDKAFLREQGIPVESYSEETLYDQDNSVRRYRIRADAYRLPGVRFSPEESAVLALAASMWEQASLGSAAARALRKLQARGVVADGAAASPLQPRIRTNDPNFDTVWKATTTRTPISFGYRPAARTGSAGGKAKPGRRRSTRRHVQPWGMGSRFGHWYVVGWDLDRGAERFFRLSRMTTPVALEAGSYDVPEDFDIEASLASLDRVFAPVTAVVEAREGAAAELRLRADGPARPESATGDRAGDRAGDRTGWDVLSLTVPDLDALAADTAGLGASAVAVEPAEFRQSVAELLRLALAAQLKPVPAFTLVRRTPAPASSSTAAQSHLTRLLDLVPYILGNQGADMEQTAQRFGVSAAQLASDLNLLFVSGPRHYPNGLMDVNFENGQIFIDNAQDLSEPVRLGMDEAAALIVGLETLSSLPGVGSTPALTSALAKLSEAAGESGRVGTAVAARLTEPEGTAGVLDQLQQAITGRRQLELRYLVPSRDEVTDRTVDPRRLFSVNDRWYLEAWCHRSEGVRNFRVDRIHNVTDSGPASWQGPDPDSTPAGLFRPSAEDELVTLLLEPAASWVESAYDAGRRADLARGRTAVELRVGNTRWIPGFIARQGGSVVVAAPESLRRETQEWLRAALANYEPPADGVPASNG